MGSGKRLRGLFPSHDRLVAYHGNGLWVGLRLGWVHTLRYMIASYSLLCRSSHFVHTLTGILALTVMQRHPSNTIDLGLSLRLLQSSQPHPSNIIRIRVWCPWSLCGLGWVSLWVGLQLKLDATFRNHHAAAELTLKPIRTEYIKHRQQVKALLLI